MQKNRKILPESNLKSLKDFATKLTIICKDIDEWPDSWAGDKNDFLTGIKILSEFKNFLVNLIEKGRSTRTIKRHANYIWALGGEIIRNTNEHGVGYKLSGSQIILKYIHPDGGPYWRYATSDADHQQYDSACSRLHKFLLNKKNE